MEQLKSWTTALTSANRCDLRYRIKESEACQICASWLTNYFDQLLLHPDMKRFFSPNIGTTGRVLRGVWAFLFFAGAGMAFFFYWIVPGILLAVAGVFTLFEAVRGWCVLRACGVKTRY